MNYKINETKKISFKQRLDFWAAFFGRLLFGVSSMATSAVAAYALWYCLNVNKPQLYALGIAIGITLTPAIWATGRYILEGAFREVKK